MCTTKNRNGNTYIQKNLWNMVKKNEIFFLDVSIQGHIAKEKLVIYIYLRRDVWGRGYNLAQPVSVNVSTLSPDFVH